MRKSLVLGPAVLFSFALFSFVPTLCFAQEEVSSSRLDAVAFVPEASASAAASLPASPVAVPAPSNGSSARIGVGVKIGTLGVGGQVAVRVLSRANVRFGFSGLGFGYNFNRDQISYGGRLRMEGAQATFDYFPFGGFHISPGALLYNGTQITGTATAPAGNSITLNHVDYIMASPLAGSLAVTFRKVAPVVLFGFGNLIPRGSRHWSISSDFGVAFSGSPRAALSLSGTACLANPPFTCADVASDPTIHSNVIAEQSSVNDKVKFFKFYPIFSVGFGWAF